MSEDYWVSFWKDRGKQSVGLDSQTRVFRTSNKAPITADCWAQTLDYVRGHFPVQEGDAVLDLCAGNGLFSRQFADAGANVVSVDISKELLSELDDLGNPRIETLCRDMRELAFPDQRFTHVFLYAGIQYISPGEAVNLLRACYHWLKPGGRLLVGDVPDAGLMWKFYNSPERRDFYFENVSHGRDVIGTWFERDWMKFLGESIGFSSVVVRDQPPEQIYAHFRFDAFLNK